MYVARVAVPKLITLRVEIGTRFPAAYTSQGKVLLAALGPDELVDVLAQPSRCGLPRFLPRDPQAFGEELCTIRARGWALADEELAPGIRSIAAPVRDGTGAVRAAMNVTVHAAETSVGRLTGEYLPLLLRTAGDVSADWALWQSRPYSEVVSVGTRPRADARPDSGRGWPGGQCAVGAACGAGRSRAEDRHRCPDQDEQRPGGEEGAVGDPSPAPVDEDVVGIGGVIPDEHRFAGAQRR